MTKNYEQLIQELIDLLMHETASDLHLSAGRLPFIRVSGELIPLSKYQVFTPEDVFGILRVISADEELVNFSKKEEIDFSYQYKNARLRCNAFIQSSSPSIALRMIQHVQSLESLRLPPILEMFARKKQGFFLVVGPVGQGKSTTLAAIIDVINRDRKEHIVTIEDPIEYIHEEKNSIIDQREIGIDSHSFPSALNAVFRQDVNVILVGEMRDPQTISTAVTAAETGHLVFSTLHTNNAAQTIDRIIDSFPAVQQNQIRTQIAGSLLGIFSQRLIPSIRGGRVPAFELMINNAAVSNLIREGRTHELNTVIETGYEYGMIDMNRSLVELVRAGEITVENAQRYSFNPRALEELL